MVAVLTAGTPNVARYVSLGDGSCVCCSCWALFWSLELELQCMVHLNQWHAGACSAWCTCVARWCLFPCSAWCTCVARWCLLPCSAWCTCLAHWCLLPCSAWCTCLLGMRVQLQCMVHALQFIMCDFSSDIHSAWCTTWLLTNDLLCNVSSSRAEIGRQRLWRGVAAQILVFLFFVATTIIPSLCRLGPAWLAVACLLGAYDVREAYCY
jgi:hypothetical protein